MEHIFRLLDFNVFNKEEDSSDSEERTYKDKNNFMVQMFGIDEKGKTYSVTAEGFRPFFYLMVNDRWKLKDKSEFLTHLQTKIGEHYKDSITKCKIIKRKKLYGFDGGKEHRFIFLEFLNMNAYNKVKVMGKNAGGIPQILGLDPRTPAPLQIDRGMKYIIHRYGTPCMAWKFHQRKGWY
jgi:hypothetical protein